MKLLVVVDVMWVCFGVVFVDLLMWCKVVVVGVWCGGLVW